MNATRTRGRLKTLRILFVTLLAVMITRITYVQQANVHLGKYTLAAIAKSEWDASNQIMPMRGSIFDANGDQLAFDMPAYNIDVYLPSIQTAGRATLQHIAQGIAGIVHAPISAIVTALNEKGTPWLQLYPYMVNVTLDKRDQLLALFHKLNMDNAISSTKIFDRAYPDGRFASNIVGFDDQAGVGLAGVEYQYNKWLSGTPGQQKFLQDATGNPVPYHPIVTKPVQNGDNVYMTIDASIQHYAEEALAAMKKRFNPAHATIIVSDPNTGAILAMSSLPNYNPNHYWTFPSATLDMNWAISAPFEPGSTFKLVTMTGALATHSIKLNQTYLSGVDYVSGVPIYDWQRWGWGRITYREAMLLSSNVGFIHIGQAEGPQTLARYIHLFGMDKPTGIDLPGEAGSITFDPNHINAVDFATSTFGQGLAVTPIQQVQEVDAIANGGRLYTPYVVQKVITPSGKVVYDHTPAFVRQVAPTAIMKQVSQIMVQDVTEGIDSPAAIPGYELAGKTGTANIPKPGGGYYKNRYNLSFIGFVPANHPRLAIFVTASEPHHTIQYGNDVATPAAKFVLENSLQYLRIPPQGKVNVSPFAGVIKAPYHVVPNVQGMSVIAADTRLTSAGFTVAAIDHSGLITRQWPQAGTRQAQGAQIVLASSHSTSLTGKVRVPSLLGMPMVEAVSVCSLLGIELDPVGDGYVTAQSLAPGQIVQLGAVLTAHFNPQAASVS